MADNSIEDLLGMDMDFLNDPDIPGDADIPDDLLLEGAEGLDDDLELDMIMAELDGTPSPASGTDDDFSWEALGLEPPEEEPVKAKPSAKKANPVPPKAPAKKEKPAPVKKEKPAPVKKEKPQRPKKEKIEEPLEPNPFLDKLAANRKIVNICLFTFAILLVVGIAGIIIAEQFIDPYKGKIIPNVSIAGVDVGGLSQEEAALTVVASVGHKYEEQNMVVHLAKEDMVLSPANTHASLDIAAAVQAAYAYGREGNAADRELAFRNAQAQPVSIDLLPYLSLDGNYINSTLDSTLQRISGTFTPSGYALSGARPPLDADSYDEANPCQTLELTVGTPGSIENAVQIYDSILSAYNQGVFEMTVDTSFLPELPAELNLDAIYGELCSEPVDAKQDPATNEITSGICGYVFSVDEAREKLASANYGDVVSVPMTYVLPAVMDFRGDYPEVLSVYRTPVSSNESYNRNMALICKALDGTVIPAGSNFSLRAAIPALTAENGFASAPEHAGYCVTPAVGGGVDQVATTLYVSAIYANLDIPQHYTANHVCGYTIRGTEVTIGQSWQDLSIRNNTKEDIVIRAKVTDTDVVVRFLGKTAPKSAFKLDSQDGYVAPIGNQVVQVKAADGYTEGQVVVEGASGGNVQLYKVEYNPETNAEISRSYFAYIELSTVNTQTAHIVG